MAPGVPGMEREVVAGSVVIGWSEGVPRVDPAEFDVLVTSEVHPPHPWVNAAVQDVVAAAEDSPEASVALVQVLRATQGLAVKEALTIESMAYSMLQQGDRFHAWRRSRPPRSTTAKPADPIELTRTGNRLDIVLNRPEVRNAFNAAMRDALIDAFELVDLDGDIDEVHLSGAGSNYCSGGDLEEFGTAADPVRAHLLRVARSVAVCVHQHSHMVTAHLHGSCVGAGVEIPSFAGTVVADGEATFRLPEVSMGLVPGAGGTVGIPRRIGRHRCAYMSLSGAKIDARTALEWGLVDLLD